MAKKEKVVDLKPKVEKISDKDLKEIQSVVNTINSLQFNIGKIETQKHQLLHNLDEAQKGVRVMQDKLVKNYGTYDVDLKDGTINWKEDEK
jgi:FtsZ-binding cell division protein ZapB|tara:strand:+ start:421 stop:693 length:273 start_codon:yes stop_codon:yes gene_type:complete